jgi:formate-dependent nitrite reductase membrane component NrfD
MNPQLEAPWGLLLAVYFMVIGAASGATLVGGWLRPTDPLLALRLDRHTARLALGLLVLACGLLVIDLGRPERFVLMLTRFSNLGSPIAVAAKLIAVKVFLLGAFVYLLERRRRAWEAGDRLLAPGPTERSFWLVHILLGALSATLAVYPALLLSRTWLSPLTATPGAGVVFLTTALLSGAAWVELFASWAPEAEEEWRRRVSSTLAFLVLAQGLLLAFLLLAADPRLGEPAVAELVAGGAGWTFWGLVVGLGLAVPFLTQLFLPRPRWVSILAAVALLVGAGTTRYLFFTVR